MDSNGNKRLTEFISILKVYKDHFRNFASLFKDVYKMNINFDIPDNKVINFSSGAKKELSKQSCRITKEIIDEASRIEASRRLSDAGSEVTQSNVKEAATHPRMIFSRKKIWPNKIVQGIAFISSLIAGGLFDTEKFSNTSTVLWFIFVLFIAISSNMYLIFNQE